MEPLKGCDGSVQWLQFKGSMQLWLPLEGKEWEGVKEREFTVQVSKDELKVKCKGRDRNGGLDDLNHKLKKEIKPESCWYCLERDNDDKINILVIDLEKRVNGEEWKKGVMNIQMFRRQHFGWGPNAKAMEDPWTTLEPGRRSDDEDPFIASRAWLCHDMLQGQTREVMQFRLLLDPTNFADACQKVPYNKLFGMDVSESHLRLFVRGDDSSPIISGELGGKCIPCETIIEMGSNAIEGSEEEQPCIDITLTKAREAMLDWKEPLKLEDDFANDVQQSLGNTPVNPKLFRLRDFAMEPMYGNHRNVTWMHFQATVQLWLPLYGKEWDGITDKEFEVKVCENALHVACPSRKKVASVLRDLCSQLKGHVMPKECYFSLEKDMRSETEEGNSLVIELAKKLAGRSWQDGIFIESMFPVEPDDSWRTLKPGRKPDVNDPFVTSRGWLCSEFDQGQTDTYMTFRLILDQKRLDEAMEKVPYYKLFGLDISEKTMKLFIRGDEPSPILLGDLEAYCVPALSTFDLSSITREVEGHKIAGTTETLPVLDVTIQKAPDSCYVWNDPLRSTQDMEAPKGSLEDYEEEQARLRNQPEENRDDWTPDDFADEQKDKGDNAFKQGKFRDAIVFYTRGLRHTPLNEKILSNRSAAYIKIEKPQLALEDALKAEEITPDWPKVFFRKGIALTRLKQFDDAIVAFTEGKECDGNNPEWERELRKTKEAQEAHLARKNRQ